MTRDTFHTALGALNAMVGALGAALFLFPVSDAVRGTVAGIVFILASGLAFLLGTAPPPPPKDGGAA